MKKIIAYKCHICRKLFDNDYSVKTHTKYHARERLANKLLKQNKTLGEIENKCDFGWRLTEIQKTITKDNCFEISYLQCCNEPAYQICFISGGGEIKVWGIGSWSGGYASFVRLGSLENPKPLNKLFKYKRNYD